MQKPTICCAVREGLACQIHHRQFLERPEVSSFRSQFLVSYATSGEEIRRVEETICFENHSGHQEKSVTSGDITKRHT